MTPVSRVDTVDDSEILSELSTQTHLTCPQLLMLYFSISGGIEALDVLHLCAVSWRYPRIFGRGPYFPFSPEIIFITTLLLRPSRVCCSPPDTNTFWEALAQLGFWPLPHLQHPGLRSRWVPGMVQRYRVQCDNNGQTFWPLVNISFCCIPLNYLIFHWSKSAFHPDSILK